MNNNQNFVFMLSSPICLTTEIMKYFDIRNVFSISSTQKGITLIIRSLFYNWALANTPVLV